jgi:hypothetical protein
LVGLSGKYNKKWKNCQGFCYNYHKHVFLGYWGGMAIFARGSGVRRDQPVARVKRESGARPEQTPLL